MGYTGTIKKKFRMRKIPHFPSKNGGKIPHQFEIRNFPSGKSPPLYVVFHCGSSCYLYGRAFAGHTWPLAVLTLVTRGWRVRGRDEVKGQPSRSVSLTLAFLWVLRIEKP